MPNTMQLAQEIYKQAQHRGEPITLEEAASLAVRSQMQSSAESRTDGAPEVEIAGLTPKSYSQSVRNETGRMAGGGPVMQMRGDPGYEDQVRIETYRPGMSQDELDFAEDRRHQRSRLTRMGAMGEIHPSQEWGYEGSDGMDNWLRHREADRKKAEEQERKAAFGSANASQYSAPGPRDLSGRAAEPRRFESVEESQAYDLRKPIHNEAGDVVGVMPSQRDIDMFQRGYVPVYNDDGSVSYGIAAGNVSALQQNQGDGVLSGFDATRRGGVGRLGPRPDLEEAGWELQSAPSPFGDEFGTVPVYRPSDEVRARSEANKQQRAMVRMAGKAGVSYDDVLEYMQQQDGDDAEKTAATMAWLRARAQEASQDDQRQRERRVKLNAMLAGPNAGSNLTNAFSLMDDGGEFGLNENQMRALAYMMPGAENRAQVEARNLEAAAQMAQRGFQASLLPALMQGIPGVPPETPVSFDDSWRTSQSQQTALKQAAGTYPKDNNANRTAFARSLESQGMSAPVAAAAADWAFDNRGTAWPF